MTHALATIINDVIINKKDTNDALGPGAYKDGTSFAYVRENHSYNITSNIIYQEMNKQRICRQGPEKLKEAITSFYSTHTHEAALYPSIVQQRDVAGSRIKPSPAPRRRHQATPGSGHSQHLSSPQTLERSEDKREVVGTVAEAPAVESQPQQEMVAEKIEDQVVQNSEGKQNDSGEVPAAQDGPEEQDRDGKDSEGPAEGEEKKVELRAFDDSEEEVKEEVNEEVKEEDENRGEQPEEDEPQQQEDLEEPEQEPEEKGENKVEAEDEDEDDFGADDDDDEAAASANRMPGKTPKA